MKKVLPIATGMLVALNADAQNPSIEQSIAVCYSGYLNASVVGTVDQTSAGDFFELQLSELIAASQVSLVKLDQHELAQQIAKFMQALLLGKALIAQEDFSTRLQGASFTASLRERSIIGCAAIGIPSPYPQ